MGISGVAWPFVTEFRTVRAPRGMVSSIDHLASSAGVALLRAGGSAADAAIGANAVLAVTSPYACGLGGDLFALVHEGEGAPAALNSSGRAGSGADAAQLRAEGHTTMPFRGDIRTVTVPGCADGWLALHRSYGRLPLADVFAPAIDYAANGFPASPHLAPRIAEIAGIEGAADLWDRGPVAPGTPLRRPGVARTLTALASGDRAAFYQGEFGAGLLRLGGGHFTAADLERANADWVTPLSVRVHGRDVWTMPPNSQGYLILLHLAIAERLDLGDPDDPRWAHLMIEAARQAGQDRPDVLYEDADVAPLLAADEVARRRAAIDPGHRAVVADNAAVGDTTYLCAVDDERRGVSLIQSNAAGFGSHLFEPATGINLHNRGLGFSLAPGHPAEFAPGRRPPHTLAPTVVTRTDGTLHAVAGTMGGDAQPQIMAQILTRMLRHGAAPGDAVGAPRWGLTGASTGFDTWDTPDPSVELEPGHPEAWRTGLAARGHRVGATETVGHAHAIAVEDGMLAGAADPRVRNGDAQGY
jgi:gamma-glutamyltranspeptidase/glutathione hydrolase